MSSGGGSTAAAIFLACLRGRLSGINPECIIVSNPNAGVIVKAIEAGFSRQNDIFVLNPKDFNYHDEAFGEAILSICKERKIDIIGQYGWKLKTPLNVIEAYKGKMINQHPGPLDPGRPDFGGRGMYGLRVHCARLYYARMLGENEHWTEATAQRVSAEYDQGALLRIRRIGILPSDDPASLQRRLLPHEHEVQIETLEDFMQGRVKEYVRDTPLIPPRHEPILVAAKRIAKLLFPRA
jgi:phosphoribosylglycinamide formyltransferase-1